MNTTLASIRDLAGAIRLVDLIDVAIVAVVAHVVLRWAKRANSRFIFAGLASLVGTYFVAKALELRLTLLLFQLVVTVAVVAVVVIFQEDLRRAFERLGQRSLRDHAPRGREHLTDVVSSAAGTLAARRIGALIVLNGREPLGRHLSGGVRLDGEPSEPLLLSIFDPSSAGHDGAVIIDGELITLFGSHLPLSHEVPGGRKLGTRHAAALGLSERSDALVVVVSEERGVISAVEEGAIEEMPDTSALRERLDRFFARHRPAIQSPLARRLFVEGLGLKLAALVLAAGGWLVVYGLEREQMVRNFTVPVALSDLPRGWMVADHQPNQARITVTGSARAFKQLDPSSLVASLSVGPLETGRQQRALTPRLVEVPRPLRVISIEPGWVRFSAFETETVVAAVEPVTEGALRGGLSLAGLRAEPKTVKLALRKGGADTIPTVRTVPIDLSTIERPTRLEVALDPPAGSWLADDQAQEVTVFVEIDGSP
jgi:diadenylate cyclase